MRMARAELDWVVRLISDVRSVRTEMNVPPGTLTPILLRDASGETLARGAAVDGGDPEAGACVGVARAAGRDAERSRSGRAG